MGLIKTMVIAAAIILAALIIGSKIESAAQPESVKLAQHESELEQAKLEQEKAEVASLKSAAANESFRSDVFERIPNSKYDDLPSNEKWIYIITLIFGKYLMTTLVALGVVGSLFLCRYEKVDFKELLTIRAVPMITITFVTIVLMALSFSLMLCSLAYSVVAMTYYAIDVFLSFALLGIVGVFVGSLTLKVSGFFYDLLDERNLTFSGK